VDLLNILKQITEIKVICVTNEVNLADVYKPDPVYIDVLELRPLSVLGNVGCLGNSGCNSGDSV